MNNQLNLTFQAVGSKVVYRTIALFMILLISSQASASTMEEVQKAFEEENYSKAIEIAKTLAEEDNLDAINGLARMYAKGKGVVQDEKEALKWIKKAANLGDGSAQYKLGRAYANGYIVKQDTNKALTLLTSSAEQENFSSLRFLANSYQEGDWLPHDPGKSIELFTEAAAKGDTVSKVTLAIMYEVGKTVPQDYQKAFGWYKSAAEEVFSLGSEQAYSMLKLGKMYHQGKGTPQNHKEALHWLLHTAETNESRFTTLSISGPDIRTQAQKYIARMYFSGDGVIKNTAEAAYWYRRAAESRDPQATHLLAKMYDDGLGMQENNTMAYALYSIAAYHGYEQAINDRNTVANNLSQHQLNRAQEFISGWEEGNIIPASLNNLR